MNAKQIVECLVEARMLPQSLSDAFDYYGGTYAGIVDNCWVIEFHTEQGAVAFMNSIDVDIEAPCSMGTSMGVTSNRLNVYVPCDKYVPEGT